MEITHVDVVKLIQKHNYHTIGSFTITKEKLTYTDPEFKEEPLSSGEFRAQYSYNEDVINGYALRRAQLEAKDEMWRDQIAKMFIFDRKENEIKVSRRFYSNGYWSEYIYLGSIFLGKPCL